jgi:hypothetical protein
MTKYAAILFFGLTLPLSACAATPVPESAPTVEIPEMSEASRAQDIAIDTQLMDIAHKYVILTLRAGAHEGEWVDAYYGPEEWQAMAKAKQSSKEVLLKDIATLIGRLDKDVLAEEYRKDIVQRARALRGVLVAADTRMRMLSGEKFNFDAEAKGQFATIPQLKPLSHYDAILARLEKEIPGNGPLAARVDAFNERYVIPKDRLQPVFDAAIAECRKRTAAFMQLPKDENFVMEFVTGKPWSGYNYYQGRFKSLIQINTDLPIRISRAVDLGCHEGYPGHHVLNLMIESKLARGKGWSEFSVNPLYSPLSVISEGSANYGIDLAFSPAERLAFERDVLYPLAGLDPKSAEAFWKLQQATEALSGARLTIAKLYLDGEIDRAKALELTQKYQLLSPARAEQQVKFTDHYRSYVINYGWGKELVKGFIERGNPDEETRWQRMEKLLSEPVLPADLLP